MGRSSVEATNACRMRAVRAVLTARLAFRRTGRRWRAPAVVVRLVVFFLLVTVDFAVRAAGSPVPFAFCPATWDATISNKRT
jgi:hypothetical protein